MIPYNLSTGNRFKYLRVYRVTTIRHNMTRQQLLARDFAGALERASAHSLYEQITDRLRELLHSHVGPGGQVPTEESLTQLFGVSRSTVRKAVQRLVDDGVLLFKYWLTVDQAEQEQRFIERLADPLKRWKLSAVDIEARRRYADYGTARDRMLKASHKRHAPWTLVDFNDQRRGRLTLIRHLLDHLPDVAVPDPKLKFPPLAHKPLTEQFTAKLKPIPGV